MYCHRASSSHHPTVLATTTLILNLIHTPKTILPSGWALYLTYPPTTTLTAFPSGMGSFLSSIRTYYVPYTLLLTSRCPRPNLQSWACTKGGFRSKRRPTLVRMAAAWGSGITGSGLSSPSPLLRSTQSRSDRAENFEANTHPYRIPTLLPYYTPTQPLIQLTPVSIDTTIRL